MDIRQLAVERSLQECVGCGKCTYACPVSHIGGDFSPRKVAEQVSLSDLLPVERGLWQCTNCGACTSLCPNGVQFHEFVREARPLLRPSLPEERNHGGSVQELMRLTAVENVRPRKNRWLTPDLAVDAGSETMLFVGCTPYFDVIFRYLRQDLLDIPRASLRLLNASGVRPRLLEGERCCGHDAYWMGDNELFEHLARLNADAIEKAGVKEVIAFCPECYDTLKNRYPTVLGPLGYRVRSLTEVLSEAIDEGRLELPSGPEVVTFQDPCRLSRLAGDTETPRTILREIAQLEDMPRSGSLSACCGNACWTECSSDTRQWQLERLGEAKGTGAERLVTACPKCLIHLSCAQTESAPMLPRAHLPITDLSVLAASRLHKT
jgi:heterodisulfide reductase subunit D